MKKLVIIILAFVLIGNLGFAKIGDIEKRVIWDDSPVTINPELKTHQKIRIWEQNVYPLGNGRLGCTVYGEPAKEHIQFNEDSMWVGNEHCTGGYQPFGDFYVEMPHEEYSNYRRELDISRAVHTITYKSGGVNYKREYFSSNPAQVMVFRFTADKKGALSGKISMGNEHEIPITAEDNTLVMKGDTSENWWWQVHLNQPKRLLGDREYASDKNIDLDIEARTKVLNEGGTLKTVDNTILFENCDSITILVAADTSYVNEREKGWTDEHPHKRVAAQIAAAEKRSYSELLKEHIADYQSLYGRMSLDLGDTPLEIMSKPTAERVKLYSEQTKKTDKPADDRDLEELLYQYARYLIISCSRPGNGALPANLQGLWLNSKRPAWRCDYHTDINLQMNYWFTGASNLAECFIPCAEWIDSIREVRKEETRKVLGVERGWLMRSENGAFGGSTWHFQKGDSAWLCQNLWDHFAFTQDMDYLKRYAYPIMKEISEFWVDHLKELPDGTLVAPDGRSPEHGPEKADGVTYDQQLCWDLFTNMIEASEILGVDAEYRQLLKEKRAKLLGPQIGRWGQLQEWMEDIDDPEDNHRHNNHLVGVYPGRQIHPTTTPKFAEAAKVSVIARGNGRTGWSKAWKISIFARLLEAERAYAMLSDLMAVKLYGNLWTTHPPFQIDCNFGYPAGVNEMLVQSHMGYVHLLPALPKAWADGSVKGMRVRGGFELDMEWKDGKLTNAVLHGVSNRYDEVKVQYGETARIFKVAKGSSITLLAEVFAEKSKPVKVFVLAGDENMLEHGLVGDDKVGENRPGTLNDVISQNERYAFLKDENGQWVKRDDVVLYDAHPIHNNTRSSGDYLKVGTVFKSGRDKFNAFGPELMFGHVVGNHFDQPVMLLRFATKHPTWFRRGSRSLGHDYLPPSSGGTSDLDGNWDVIHFNWGIWDTAYRDPKPGDKWHRDKFNGKITTSIDQYEKNLRKLVARLKKTGATLIWGTVTPIHKDCPGRFEKDAIRYNKVAEKIMKENGVIINDLFAESVRQGYPKRPDVHSIGDLAPKVTETILAALKDRKNKTKPLPRVLLIGDSITGSYQKKVKNNLDGKAFVCKNPGNAEHTGTGLAKIDEWLDLEKYLLNGQEYLELVNSVKDSLKQIERFYPGYKGQGYELAGLAWFQGIKDCQSDSMADAYEENLVNLIRDLRDEFNVPKLPVVVAAVGYNGDNMSGNTLKVHKAQKAVGDPEKYPEFAGNVKTVDTRKFWPDDKLALKGREWDYKNNAESFLQIGESLGMAMIEMLNTKSSDVNSNLQSAPDRPNVLFLFADDQSNDTVNALGYEFIKTPNLDRLVHTGVAFTNAYIMGGSSPAVCSPSRASLFSGRTLWNIESQGLWRFEISEKYRTLPQVFRESGYVTFATGKNEPGKSGHFNRSFSTGDKILFRGMTNSQYRMPLFSYSPTNDYSHKKAVLHEGKHSAEIYADACIKFLEGQAKSDKPFFAYVSFQTPHDPRQCPDEFREMYKDEEIKIPESYMPVHPFDNGMLKIRDEMLAPFPRTKEVVQKHIADYYATITHTDAQIGRILDALEKNGQDKNTIVVFSGDNGLAVGRHGLIGKQNVYDHSVHVPFIISGPGIPKGELRDQLCYIYDIYPTLCERAGLEIPDTVQFESLNKVIADKKADHRDHLYFAFMSWQRSVQDKQFKLIEYCVNNERHTQLFDLANDPHEINNLAGDSKYTEKMKSLRVLLKKEAVKLNDGNTPYEFTDKQGKDFWGMY